MKGSGDFSIGSRAASTLADHVEGLYGVELSAGTKDAFRGCIAQAIDEAVKACAPAAWRRLADSIPAEFATVLTIHEDDLYPVPAWRIVDADGVEHWLREAEGPEDTDDGRPGKHGPLYRRPTHWMPIPEGPFPVAAPTPGEWER